MVKRGLPALPASVRGEGRTSGHNRVLPGLRHVAWRPHDCRTNYQTARSDQAKLPAHCNRSKQLLRSKSAVTAATPPACLSSGDPRPRANVAGLWHGAPLAASRIARIASAPAGHPVHSRECTAAALTAIVARRLSLLAGHGGREAASNKAWRLGRGPQYPSREPPEPWRARSVRCMRSSRYDPYPLAGWCCSHSRSAGLDCWSGRCGNKRP